MLIGVSPLLAGLLAPAWGRLADRHGQKGIAVKALVAYVILLALSAAVQGIGQLFALRIGVGLFGGIGPLGLAMATASAPREDTGRAVGMVQAAQILSAAIGPLAVTALVARTRRVDHDLDLLELAGADGVLLERSRVGVAGRGVVSRVAVGSVDEALAAIEVDDPVGVPGTGPVAFGTLPFQPDAAAEMVVPEVVWGRAEDGTRWVTTIAPARVGL